MKPNRILPDLQCSLICEDVRQEASGNFILIGIISLIRVPQIPITALKLCVFNRWTAGIGQFSEETRLVGPDGMTILRKSQVRFQLADASKHATNVSVFPNIEFPAIGVYHVEVLVDDVMKLRFPIPLEVVQHPQQPHSGPPPGAKPPQPSE